MVRISGAPGTTPAVNGRADPATRDPAEDGLSDGTGRGLGGHASTREPDQSSGCVPDRPHGRARAWLIPVMPGGGYLLRRLLCLMATARRIHAGVKMTLIRQPWPSACLVALCLCLAAICRSLRTTGGVARRAMPLRPPRGPASPNALFSIPCGWVRRVSIQQQRGRGGGDAAGLGARSRQGVAPRPAAGRPARAVRGGSRRRGLAGGR